MRTEKWLVTGASGQLGGHLLRLLDGDARVARVLALAGRNASPPTQAETARIDLRDQDALIAAVRAFAPHFVVHAGAMTAVGDAFKNPDDALRVNAAATEALADAAAACGARLVFTSTDMVFDGCLAPYSEDSPPSPTSVYGRSKVAAERMLARFPRALAVRIPLMYGHPCTPRPTTFVQQLTALSANAPLNLFVDEYRTPVWVVDAARALIGLARSGLCDAPRRPATGFDGLIHVAGPERLSRLEMIQRAARLLGLPTASIRGVSRLSISASEPRPADLSLWSRCFGRVFPDLAPRAMDRQTVAPPGN